MDPVTIWAIFLFLAAAEKVSTSPAYHAAQLLFNK